MHHILLFFALLGFIFINIYFFIRGWQALPENRILRAVYTGIFLFFTISFFLGVFLDHRLTLKTVNTFKLIGGYWIVLLIVTLIPVLFADFLRILNKIFRLFPVWVINHYSTVKLIYFAFILLLVFIITSAGLRQFAHPKITELKFVTDKERNGFDNLVLVAVSDIHLGNIARGKRLAKWIEMINNQDPDVVLLVGDIFDWNFDFTESKTIEKELMKLRSRYGVYAVLGNHEYYAGINKSINSLEHAGIKLLRDQSVTIDNRILIIGRDDATNRKRKTTESLLSGLDISFPIILLDHQPTLNESVKNKIDLQISGHLHNGQIYPYNLVLANFWELVYGYQKIEDTQFYVSSGLGLRYVPIRIGTQSEIVRIHLRVKSDTLTMSK